MIGLISLLLKFAGILFGEYFESRALARKEKKEFDLSQAAIQAMYDRAILKMRDNARKESGQAQNIDDQIDNDLRG